MLNNNKYFTININKIILKKIIKFVFIFLFLIALYICVMNFVFLRSTGLSYTPPKRYGLSIVIENAFGEMVFKCYNQRLSDLAKDFVSKHQIFNPKTHDFNYLFGMGKDNCLVTQGSSEPAVIPYLSIWYKDTDPIKVSLSNTRILEDSYVFSKILEIAKSPCRYIPSKSELLELTQAEKEGFLPGILESYLYAREALECDISSPKNEEVQLYFHNYDGGKTAITVKLQRQGE